MYIEQIRHATVILTYKEYKILIDPMFSKKESMLSLQIGKLIRMKKTNPLVDLPSDMEERLAGVTHALLTHNHFDHIDEAAIEYLKRENISIFCIHEDEPDLRKKGLKTIPLREEEINEFLGGTIKLIPCRHGWGWISKTMGKGTGYIIEMPEEPSLYITGDTVLTDEVREAVDTYRPEWTIVPAGRAQLGMGKPLIMPEDEVLELVEISHGRVVLNHMETMDHCLVDRKEIRELIRVNKLGTKVVIPNNGDIIDCI